MQPLSKIHLPVTSKCHLFEALSKADIILTHSQVIMVDIDAPVIQTVAQLPMEDGQIQIQSGGGSVGHAINAINSVQNAMGKIRVPIA